MNEADESINEVADGARDMLQELLQTLEEAASSSGYVVALVDNINKAIASVCVLHYTYITSLNLDLLVLI